MIDPAPGGRVIGMSIVLAKGRTLFIADTNVTEMPEADDLVEIACEAARAVRAAGLHARAWPSCPIPRSAIRMGERAEKVREAVAMLDARGTSTSSTRARCRRNWRSSRSGAANYPFMRLTGAGQRADHAGHPLGLDLHQAGAGAGRGDGGGADPARACRKSVQICPLSASVSKILQMADHGRLRRAAGRAPADRQSLTASAASARQRRRPSKRQAQPKGGAPATLRRPPMPAPRNDDARDRLRHHQHRGLRCAATTARRALVAFRVRRTTASTTFRSCLSFGADAERRRAAGSSRPAPGRSTPIWRIPARRASSSRSRALPPAPRSPRPPSSAAGIASRTCSRPSCCGCAPMPARPWPRRPSA